MLWEIAFYVLRRDGRIDPNNDEWRLLVGRAEASLEAVATAAGLVPDRLLHAREGRQDRTQ
jgi:hypothetical protein